jgi:hypothetical protein
LFYSELGGTPDKNIPNTSAFNNEKASTYWLGTENASNPNNAWGFSTGSGRQGSANKGFWLDVWVVSPGQVAAVPVPGAVWIFGTGLVGLLSLKRRGQTAG